MHQPGKSSTVEKGLQYLRELAVLRMVYSDLDDDQAPKDPDEICSTWWKFIQSATVVCQHAASDAVE